MREIALVAVGGGLGALVRYGVGLAAARLLGAAFPWGTLAVNVAGCLLMGVVMQKLLVLETHDVSQAVPRGVGLAISLWRHGVAIGFLGGLTTFSSFSGDTLRELQAGRPLVALANVAANVLLSLLAVWIGFAAMEAVD